MLLRITHPHRLRSTAQAVRLLETLRIDSVIASDFATAEPAHITQLVAAATTDPSTQFSWHAGSFADAWPQLIAFTLGGGYHSLHLSVVAGVLSVWTSGRCRLRARVPAADRAPFEEVVGTSITQQPTALVHDGRAVGEIKLVVQRGEPDTIELETPWVELAFAMFSRLTDFTNQSSFVTSPTPAGKPALAALLTALGVPIEATLDVAPHIACSLTELFPAAALEWQARGVTIRLPALTIEGTVAPGTDEQSEWIAKIDQALISAGLA